MTKESQNKEWKELWRDEYLKWICGFANADGGQLIIGKNDKGEVVEVKNARELLELLPNKVRDLIGVMVDVNLRKSAGKEYLEIAVPAYPNPISYKGEYYYRSGSTNPSLKGAALDRFILRKQGKHWDGVPITHVKVKHLSKATIDTFRQLARKSHRLDSSVLKEANKGLLEKLYLFEGSYLKRAAILLFHPDPEKFVTGSFVKVGYFRNDADLLYHDEIHGDLFTQAKKTIDLLLTKYLKAGISYQGIQRIESFPVPDEALREAVLNALIHKDYSSGTPIQISVYDDKLMIWNSGELPQHWSIDKLIKKHSSHPFNPVIANAFFRAGEIEAWGRGIERILTACKSAQVPIPRLRNDHSGLWVEFVFSEAWKKSVQAVGEKQSAIQLPTQSATQSTDPVERLLSCLVLREMSSSELRKALNIKHRPTFRENYLHPALEANFIEMTIPDKPNSRLQKYRITEAGKSTLQKKGA